MDIKSTVTGRDLIIFILENGLEDTPIYKDSKLVYFQTVHEAAEKWDVGVATILTWMNLGQLKGITIGNEIYIPASAKPSTED